MPPNAGQNPVHSPSLPCSSLPCLLMVCPLRSPAFLPASKVLAESSVAGGRCRCLCEDHPSLALADPAPVKSSGKRRFTLSFVLLQPSGILRSIRLSGFHPWPGVCFVPFAVQRFPFLSFRAVPFIHCLFRLTLHPAARFPPKSTPAGWKRPLPCPRQACGPLHSLFPDFGRVRARLRCPPSQRQ